VMGTGEDIAQGVFRGGEIDAAQVLEVVGSKTVSNGDVG
jgi:hypothetical protein